ncbi:MAG TPA: AraC family transcriptional regulator [Pyrinomonadaceae bacterium]|nr:AraC family transcriptional regulator [Pyrinomonadaceae bacterium]
MTETLYAQSLKLPEHSHSSAYFCFVLQGSFTERQGRGLRTCGASTLIFHPADDAHSDQFHTRARCFNLQLDVRWVERLRQHSTILNRPATWQGGLLAQLAAKLYREFRQLDELSPLVIEGLALEILGEATRAAANRPRLAPPRWLLQAREYLHEQFSESLTLSKVAGLVGVHETHLAREFRRYYGCTAGEYIRRRRIEFACLKLSASNTPLSEIALSAGFVDQSHFTRTFKRAAGMSPAQYRKLFRAR